jgi:ankyrin repeat protein
VDVIAWDCGLSPLHLAILNGHLDIIELLVSEYAADVLLPVKLVCSLTITTITDLIHRLVHHNSNSPRAAIMTIVLALSLPGEKAKAVVKLLLKLGATSAQADLNHYTVFQYVVGSNNHDVLDVLLEDDRPVALSVIDNIGSSMNFSIPDSPLTTAINKGHKEMVSRLLELGAKSIVSFDEWIKVHLAKNVYAKNNTAEQNQQLYREAINQPIISAAEKEMGQSIIDLLAHGADPATLEKSSHKALAATYNSRYVSTQSLLDVVQKKLKSLRE